MIFDIQKNLFFMKKKKLELGKKLFLGKTIVSRLTDSDQEDIQGGATQVSLCIQCHTNNPSCGQAA